MKKFSKILSMILCLSLVMASTLIPTSASANTTAVDTSAYIFYDDVQGETVGNAPSQWALTGETYRFSLKVKEEAGNKFIRVTRGRTEEATGDTAYTRPHVKSTTPFSIPVNSTDTIVVEAKMRASSLAYYHMLRLMPAEVPSYGQSNSEISDAQCFYALIRSTLDGKLNAITSSYNAGSPSATAELATFSVNTWHPVKCVINLGTKAVVYYYNGVQIATGSLNNNKALAADIAEIGFTMGFAGSSGSQDAATMDIDDIKIYKPAGRPNVTAASNGSVANPGFTLQFDKAMDEASLNANTVKLYKGATEVSYTGSYNATTKTYTLTDVNANFAAGDVYQIKLTEGVYAANDALFRENGKLTGGEEFTGYIGYTVGTTYLSDTLETGETVGQAPTKWMLADTGNAYRHGLTVQQDADGNKFVHITRGTSDIDSSSNANYRPHVHNKTALAVPFAEGTGKLVIEAKMRASNLEYAYMLRVTDDGSVPGYAYGSTGLWDGVGRYALLKASTSGRLYAQAGGQTHPVFTEVGDFAPGTTWYPVKCVIDFDTNGIQYYLNNVLIGTGSISASPDMAGITNLTRIGFSMAFETGASSLKSTAATMDFDDVAVYSLNREYQSEIIYGQSALTSGNVTPGVVWVNNTGESKDIKVYSVLYKKVGENLAVQSVASTSTAVTVAADGVYDGKAPTVNVPETEDDFVVKTFVWTTGFAPVMEAGTLD